MEGLPQQLPRKAIPCVTCKMRVERPGMEGVFHSLETLDSSMALSTLTSWFQVCISLTENGGQTDQEDKYGLGRGDPYLEGPIHGGHHRQCR